MVKVKYDNLGIPTQIGNVKSNPNNEYGDFWFWFIINSVLIFFIITILLNNVLIGSLNWILSLLTIRYVNQFLLLGLVLVADFFLLMIIKNFNIAKSGLVATLVYFTLDYIYLAENYSSLSLLDWNY